MLLSKFRKTVRYGEMNTVSSVQVVLRKLFVQLLIQRVKADTRSLCSVPIDQYQ